MATYPIPISEDCPFGLYNLPFGIFSTPEGVGLGAQRRAGVAIGDYVLELHHLAKYGLLDEVSETCKSLEAVFLEAYLNAFASLPDPERTKCRSVLIDNLSNAQSPLFTNAALNRNAFILRKDVQTHLPMKITDYTDAFSSLIHAENSLYPLGLALPPAFVEYPMSYNGRISSIKVSGVDIVRPSGFFPCKGESQPTFQPTQQLDFEIELGAFISTTIESGTAVDAKAAADHIFGFVLHNDWSARDIQRYEMPPLGPFHSKGFITTISPWIVTMDALKESWAGPPASNSTKIHPMLVADAQNHGVYDIEFRATVARGGDGPVEIVRSSFTDSYWSLPQMIAYQSSSLLCINTGDLVASGTISSPLPVGVEKSDKGSLAGSGCLLEVFAQNHVLPKVGGKPMSWIEDGDEFAIEGWFRTPDGRLSGFGGVTNRILPARLLF